jgi:hypothetical protein
MNLLLRTILEYNRAEPKAFIEEVLLPFLDDRGLDYEVDVHYNVYVGNGDTSKDLYIAHTDTCDRVDTPRLKFVDTIDVEAGDLIAYLPTSNHRCLGADDGAGVYILLSLIDANVDGRYLFTTGEEKGLIGMRYWMSIPYNVESLVGVENCYEFDRQGEHEIIVVQSGQQMADYDEAFKLSEELCACGLELYPSSQGVYTDNIELWGIVPNVYNIAVGYQSQHTPNEWLNVTFVEKLLGAWLILKGCTPYGYDF